MLYGLCIVNGGDVRYKNVWVLFQELGVAGYFQLLLESLVEH